MNPIDYAMMMTAWYGWYRCASSLLPLAGQRCRHHVPAGGERGPSFGDLSAHRTRRTWFIKHPVSFCSSLAANLGLHGESSEDPKLAYARELYRNKVFRERIELLRQKFPGTMEITADCIVKAATNYHADTPFKKKVGFVVDIRPSKL